MFVALYKQGGIISIHIIKDRDPFERVYQDL